MDAKVDQNSYSISDQCAGSDEPKAVEQQMRPPNRDQNKTIGDRYVKCEVPNCRKLFRSKAELIRHTR